MISLRSKPAIEILNFFYLNPEESLYVNEMERRFCIDRRNLIKKVRELEKEGILKTKKRGNLKLYSINTAYPLYH